VITKKLKDDLAVIRQENKDDTKKGKKEKKDN
jgi:hypothetical protein